MKIFLKNSTTFLRSRTPTSRSRSSARFLSERTSSRRCPSGSWVSPETDHRDSNKKIVSLPTSFDFRVNFCVEFCVNFWVDFCVEFCVVSSVAFAPRRHCQLITSFKSNFSLLEWHLKCFCAFSLSRLCKLSLPVSFKISDLKTFWMEKPEGLVAATFKTRLTCAILLFQFFVILLRSSK
jgi:hypothetical protein